MAEAGGGGGPPRFWQNKRRRITTRPPRFSDLAPYLYGIPYYIYISISNLIFQKVAKKERKMILMNMFMWMKNTIIWNT